VFKTPAIAAVLIGRQGDNGTSGRISKLTLLVMDYTSPPSTMTMQPGMDFRFRSVNHCPFSLIVILAPNTTIGISVRRAGRLWQP